MTATGTRWLALDGAANARVVVPGVLLRSDNLQALSARDVRTLVDEHSLEVVIDLRTDVEVAREGPGPLVGEPRVRIEHRSLYPDAGENTDLVADTVLPWGFDTAPEDEAEPPAVRSYLSYLLRRPDSIAAAVLAIARSRGAVLVHCAAGKDRTGVVVALALEAAGFDRAAIVADYIATEERIVQIVARLASSDTYRRDIAGGDPGRYAPLPGTIERVLELVSQRHGGARDWLAVHGVDDDDLESLRRRLGGP
jgi:protein-tyrosine phosphatase